ncbi:hypothetical protein H0H93_006141 [Arthromyces matolae]|nr:hypothetical protein H0H93_006141 [Arthromyces matolae]
MHFLRVLTPLLLAALGRAVVGPGVVTGDTAVHDPTMCKDSSGTYFVFSTGVGIEIRTSTDRTAWTKKGVVWPNGASWTDAYTGTSNGALWAPDCTYLNGVFYLYYAASTFGSQNVKSFIMIVITTNSLLVCHLLSQVDDRLTWPSIPITSLAQRTANSGAIEASVIYKYGSYYYLFTSWDNCCEGTSSTYNIRVGRSTSPTGGYVDQSGVSLLNGGGTLVLQTHDSIYGPGGQDLMTDNDGPILVYHYYTSTGSYLMPVPVGHQSPRLLLWLASNQQRKSPFCQSSRLRNAQMGFFSSRKLDDSENYPSNNDKSITHVIRSRFYGKNKGKERDAQPSFSALGASAAQTLSDPTPPASAASIRQPSPLSQSLNNNGLARPAGSNFQRVQTEKMLPTTPTRKPAQKSLTSSPSSSSTPKPVLTPTPRRQQNQNSNVPSSPLRPSSDNATLTLAQRLNELAAANSQGLLNDDEYRLLRQNLFERFATSTNVPTEVSVVPVSSPNTRRATSQEQQPRPLSNFQVEINRTPSIRSKSSVTSGVASFLRRATSRRTPSGSKDFSDTSSTFSASSKTSNIFLRGLTKKSSASSVHTTTSRQQADTISISSHTGLGSQSSHSHPPASISISRSNRRLATPPSSFPSPRTPNETYRVSAFNTDMMDDEHLQTTAEIRQEISMVEAEARRLMDAFNGLEMTTLAKLQRHRGRSNLAESGYSASAPTTPRRTGVDSDKMSLKSAKSAASLARSAHSRGPSKGVIISPGPPNSAKSGSIRRKDSFSSVGEDRKPGARGNVPPVPTLSATYGHLGIGSVSNVSLARSHVTMSAVPEDDHPMFEAQEDDEMEDIQRRREEVNERYAARLEYLRAKLKGAQLREKLARK